MDFANEIGGLSREFGVDPSEVMDVVCADMKLNISRAYLMPGIVLEGLAFPKTSELWPTAPVSSKSPFHYFSRSFRAIRLILTDGIDLRVWKEKRWISWTQLQIGNGRLAGKRGPATH
jgi:hypothetical protein